MDNVNMVLVRKNDGNSLNFEKLVHLAVSMGASNARVISSREISVEDELAKLCKEPRCGYYGLSPSCPPHVSGPSGFRRLQETIKYALVVRIIFPSCVLHSDERREVLKLLHEIVACVEQEAIGMGYVNSKAFSGGSCKDIFCHNYAECRRLSGDGECRYPKHARPSMSGFGINVFRLMKSCGWPVKINTGKVRSDSEPMTWVAGLVMID